MDIGDILNRVRQHDCQLYDDVIKWKPFSALLALCEGIHRSPVDSHHKGQWSGAWMFSLIWTNSWPNERDTGDLRRHRAYYDVTVMWETSHCFYRQIAFSERSTIANRVNPDSKVHVTYMGAHLGPTGPSWVPCWPHEPCYQGSYEPSHTTNNGSS